MKKLVCLFVMLVGVVNGQCDYYNPKPFPSSLELREGESLCIDTHTVTPWTSISVYDGGAIYIRDASRLRIQGSLTVFPGGKVYVEDCNSKLEVNGTYNGGYNTCEIDYYCSDCSGLPFELVSGSKIWDEWCCIQPLPVELASFTVTVHEDYNEIGWTTLMEVNSSHFELEKSEDGVIWNHIRTIPSNNTSTISGYTVIDQEESTCFYRLTQFDYDGSHEVFDIILAKRDTRVLVKILSLTGREVTMDYKGIVIKVYNDGFVEKKFNY